jgi:5-methylcytosine-specific restriction enzyme A
VAAKPCLTCKRPMTGPGSHHPQCNPRAGLRTRSQRDRRAALVQAHRLEHGDWCPGWNRDPHPAADLTADHLVEVSAGGDEHGELVVLCRSCNSSKRHG